MLAKASQRKKAKASGKRLAKSSSNPTTPNSPREAVVAQSAGQHTLQQQQPAKLDSAITSEGADYSAAASVAETKTTTTASGFQPTSFGDQRRDSQQSAYQLTSSPASAVAVVGKGTAPAAAAVVVSQASHFPTSSGLDSLPLSSSFGSTIERGAAASGGPTRGYADQFQVQAANLTSLDAHQQHQFTPTFGAGAPTTAAAATSAAAAPATEQAYQPEASQLQALYQYEQQQQQQMLYLSNNADQQQQQSTGSPAVPLGEFSF